MKSIGLNHLNAKERLGKRINVTAYY